jgi:hypothetical protein
MKPLPTPSASSLREIVAPTLVPPKIAAKVAEIRRALPGTNHFTVLHDDWCAMMNEKSAECNCDPDVMPGKIETHRVMS